MAVDSSLHLHVHKKFFHAHVRCEFESISISPRPTMLHDSPNKIQMTNVSIPHPHSPNTKDPGVGNQEYTVISPDDTGLCTSWSFATLNESRSTDVPVLTQQDVTGAPVSTSFPTLLPRVGDHPAGKQRQSLSSLHSPPAVILGDDNAIVDPPTTTIDPPSSTSQTTTSFEPMTHQGSTIISGSARSVSSISHASSGGTQSKRQRKSGSRARSKACRSKKSDSKHTIRSKKLKASSADNRWSKRFHWPDEVSELSCVLSIELSVMVALTPILANCISCVLLCSFIEISSPPSSMSVSSMPVHPRLWSS